MRDRTGLLRRPGVFALAALVIWAAPVAAQDPITALYAFEEALAGDDEKRMGWPTAVATGATDEIIVAHTGAQGPTLWIFRNQGAAEGWVRHASIRLPATAYSLASKDGRHLISTRRPGWLLEVQGPDYQLRELALSERVTPGAVAYLADDGLLVHDLAVGRLLVLDRDLEIRNSVTLPGAVAAVAPGPGGGFYATLPQAAEVRRYGANGEELAVLSVPGLEPAPAWPVGLVAKDNGEIIVADRHGGRLLVLETSGRWAGSGSRRGWGPGLLRFPADIARLPDGRIVVADQGNGRLQLFRRLEQ